MKALIIVDVQIDFVPGGALEIVKGDTIIPVINQIEHKFDLVVATQDWHPSDHKSFASNHPLKQPFEIIDLNGITQVLWPDHCVQETNGASFHPELQMDRVAAIFRKGMDKEIDSYSGFYDNQQKKSTGLAGYLREKQVRDVYVCGLAGDICVYYTVKDAIKEGFDTYIIEDASMPLDIKEYARVKKEIWESGGKVLKSIEIN